MERCILMKVPDKNILKRAILVAMANSVQHKCSFCQESNERMVAGPGVFICWNCIELCKSIYESAHESEALAAYKNESDSKCNFCGSRENVNCALFTKSDKFICAECICLCAGIFTKTQFSMEEGFSECRMVYEMQDHQ